LSKDPASITMTNKTWTEEEIAVFLTHKWFYCNSAIPSVRAKLKVYNRTYVTWGVCFSFNVLSVRKTIILCRSCHGNSEGLLLNKMHYMKTLRW